MAKGVDQADTKEVGEVADIIKDLSESYCNIVKAMYHKEITIAMEDAQYGEDYDYKGARYYSSTQGGGRPSTQGGSMRMYDERMSDYYRDMDRDDNRMYYSNGRGMNDSRMGKSSNSRVRYFETKSMHASTTEADKKAKMDKFEEYMDDIYDDVEEMLKGESAEMKTMARQKLMSMANAM